MTRVWLTSAFSVAVLTVIVIGCSRNAGRDASSGATLLRPSAVQQRVEDAGASGGGGSTIGDVIVHGELTFRTGSGALSGPYEGVLDSLHPNVISILWGSLTGTGRLEGVVLGSDAFEIDLNRDTTTHLVLTFRLPQSEQLYRVEADLALTSTLTVDTACPSGNRRTITLEGPIPQFGLTTIVMSHCEPVL